MLPEVKFATFEWWTGGSKHPLRHTTPHYHYLDGAGLIGCRNIFTPPRAKPDSIRTYTPQLRPQCCGACISMLRNGATGMVKSREPELRVPTENEIIWLLRHDDVIVAAYGYRLPPGKRLRYCYLDAMTLTCSQIFSDTGACKVFETFEAASAVLDKRLNRQLVKLQAELDAANARKARLTEESRERLLGVLKSIQPIDRTKMFDDA